MANPLALILVVGAAAVVLGKKKKKKKTSEPVEEEPMLDEPEVEPEIEPEEPEDVPVQVSFQAVKMKPKFKVMQVHLPTWNADVEERARHIMTMEFSGQFDGPVTFFRLAKKAAFEIFPGQPWPTKMSDEEGVEVGPGDFRKKWVVNAGAMGGLLDSIWKKLIGTAYSVTGYRAP